MPRKSHSRTFIDLTCLDFSSVGIYFNQVQIKLPSTRAQENEYVVKFDMSSRDKRNIDDILLGVEALDYSGTKRNVHIETERTVTGFIIRIKDTTVTLSWLRLIINPKFTDPTRAREIIRIHKTSSKYPVEFHLNGVPQCKTLKQLRTHLKKFTPRLLQSQISTKTFSQHYAPKY